MQRHEDREVMCVCFYFNVGNSLEYTLLGEKITNSVFLFFVFGKTGMKENRSV